MSICINCTQPGGYFCHSLCVVNPIKCFIESSKVLLWSAMSNNAAIYCLAFSSICNYSAAEISDVWQVASIPRRQSSLSRSPVSAASSATTLRSSTRATAPTGSSPTSPAATSSGAGAAASSPGSLQAQLSSVKLKHCSPTSPNSASPTSTAESPVLTPSPPLRPPLPPPPSPHAASRLASPERQSASPLSVTSSILQSQFVQSQSVPGALPANPSRAAPPPPPPPPPPLGAVPCKMVSPKQQIKESVTSISSPHGGAHAQPVQSQQDLGQVRYGENPSRPDSMNTDSRGSYARQLSVRQDASPAASKSQHFTSPLAAKLRSTWQVESLPKDESPATRHTDVHQSGQQPAWLQQPGSKAESGEAAGIAAVHAPGSAAAPAPAAPPLPGLQPGLKKRWPTVQSNPLYQQAEAEASPGPAPAAATSGVSSIFSAKTMRDVVIVCKPVLWPC